MNVIYYKIWADLWGNKSRTIQVVLIIALGAFGIGLVLGARNLTAEAANLDWRKGDPPGYKISVNPPLTDEQLEGLKTIKGIRQIEGFFSAQIQWRHNASEPWKVATLRSRADYAEQKMARQDLVQGVWPTGNSFGVEWNEDTKFGIQLGDTLEIRYNDRTHPITINGVINAYDLSSQFENDLTLYTTRRRFGELIGNENFSIVEAKLQPRADGSYDWDLAAAVDAKIQDRLDKLDIESAGLMLKPPRPVRYDTPDVSFAASILNSVFLILGVIGAVLVVLGILLVYNSVSALLAQQVFQIGVMKAIGARQGQILRIYLILILIYGCLAYLVSVPLAALAAHGIKLLLLNRLEVTDRHFALDTTAIIVQGAVAFLAPILASLAPVFKGAGITVREAINSYGLGGTAGLLETLLARVKHLSYSLLLTIGNTFRNLSRVTITQCTLVGSGILFVAVMGVRDATNYTFGDALTAIHRYNVTLNLKDVERKARIEQLLGNQPGLVAVEAWNQENATARPVAQAKHTVNDQQVTLLGIPFNSKMYRPQLLAGRWLQPGDDHVLALHTKAAGNIGVQVGDWVTLRYKGNKESNWLVVGIFFDPAVDRSAYAPEQALGAALARVNKANVLYIQTTQTDAAATKALALNLRQFLEDHNMALATSTFFSADTLSELVQRRTEAYSVMISLLSIMAFVVGVVGGIGLSGVLSLSVLERTREIGVMRAIGASSGRIAWLFIGEGLIQGLLSWLIASPLGIPAAYFMATHVLSAVLGDQLVYTFYPTGILLWLLIIVVLAMVASWFPARNATRVSVRESLAYQ